MNGMNARCDRPRIAAPTPVAPAWHTIALVIVLLLLAVGGARLQSRSAAGGSGLIAQHEGIVSIYVSTMAFEWATVGWVWLGVRRRIRLRELVGGRWRRPRDIGRDLVVAVLFWVVLEATAALMHLLLGLDAAKSMTVLLPRGGPEIVLWILVSISAGFCEETVFRGYLQRQFHALSTSAPMAVLAQAVVFGFSHGYQGWKQVAIITVLGALYGVLAWWRGSLRPGMAAHAWTDIFSGILSPRG